MLRALCGRVLGDSAQFEDAVQEAILQALLNLDRLQQAERFGAWLGGIGLNVCRRMLRARSYEHWSLEALYGGRHACEPVEDRAGPAELAEASDLAERVRRAVAGLPRGQRAAVTLFYLAGLTHAEVAIQLGVEVGAVKARLHKARGSLRQCLQEEWEMNMTVQPESQLVEMRVGDVRRQRTEDEEPEKHSEKHIVILDEVGGTRRLLIWVGRFEGESIALSLHKIQAPRPVTFAFMANILQSLDAKLREVHINKLAGDVFYAAAMIEGAAGIQSLDARPSDAINLALLTGAPIRVEPVVLLAVEAPQPAHEHPPLDEMDGGAEIVAAVTSRWKV